MPADFFRTRRNGHVVLESYVAYYVAHIGIAPYRIMSDSPKGNLVERVAGGEGGGRRERKGREGKPSER